MENLNSRQLYWYGFRANVKKGFGKFLIFLSIISLVLCFFNAIFGIIIFIILLVLGIVLIAKGSSQRFDYERRSGHILYRGGNV